MAKALTVAAVEKLKPDPTKRLEVPDGLLSGLYLVVQTSGAKSWAVRYRAHGKPKKLTLGSFPALALDKAREKARLALVAVQAGEDPAAVKADEKATADIRKLDTVVRNYVTRYCKPRNKTWKGTARLIGLNVNAKQDDIQKAEAVPGSALALWGHRQIGTIKRAEVTEHINTIVDRGKQVHANRTLAALKHFFDWAVDQSLLEASPCANAKPPASERKRDRCLTDDEIRALWTACDTIGRPFGPLVKMLLLTGQRRDEVGELSWAEITGDLWTIPRERAKNDKAHTVHLTAPVLALLEGLPNNSEFAFTTTGTTAVSGFSRAKQRIDKEMLKALRKRAEENETDPDSVTLPYWRLHDLRRTAATGMARAGTDIAVVERTLNHVSGTFAGVVGIYQQFEYEGERKQALEAWAQLVLEITGQRRPSIFSQLKL